MTDEEFWRLPVWAAYVGVAAKLGRLETLAETVRLRDNGGTWDMWIAVSVDGHYKRTILYPNDWKPMVKA